MAPPKAASPGVGSPEQLQTAFDQAAAAANRAVGLWLARDCNRAAPDDAPRLEAGGAGDDLRALRAVVRAAATAYARRLRRNGETPERMLVLVKATTGHRGLSGFGTQQLTNDVVRWSIEAYFSE